MILAWTKYRAAELTERLCGVGEGQRPAHEGGIGRGEDRVEGGGGPAEGGGRSRSTRR